MKFYKIKNYYNDEHWVKEGLNEHGEIWINMRGGWCLKNDSDEIIEVADYPDEESFEDAYRKEIYSYLINLIPIWVGFHLKGIFMGAIGQVIAMSQICILIKRIMTLKKKVG